MSTRIVERFVLARRVAARVTVADAVGDPKELLLEFNTQVSRVYADLNLAHSLHEKYTALLKEKNNPPPNATDAEAMQGWVARLKALRAELPVGGSNSYVSLAAHLGHSYGRIRRIAEDLCLAILQQLALPPKTRKSIEAAAKVWSRERRWKAKAKYHMEEYGAEVVAKYLDDVEMYRKYQALFHKALTEGAPHSQEGEGATKIKVGSFTLVNTGGFSSDDMERISKLVQDSEQRMRRIGLSQVCYGDILVTNRIQSRSNVQAFYLPSKDEMFIRADAKVTLDMVHTICHELTHRYEHKFLSGEQKRVIQRIYHRIDDEPVEYPKIGEEITHEGKTLRVVDYDFRRKTVTMNSPDDLKTCHYCKKPVEGHQGDAEHVYPVIQKYVYKLNVEAYNRAAGKAEAPDKLKFVTPYARSGGPSENFAEMVAHHALGKLPSMQLELLKPLL